MDECAEKSFMSMMCEIHKNNNNTRIAEIFLSFFTPLFFFTSLHTCVRVWVSMAVTALIAKSHPRVPTNLHFNTPYIMHACIARENIERAQKWYIKRDRASWSVIIIIIIAPSCHTDTSVLLLARVFGSRSRSRRLIGDRFEFELLNCLRWQKCFG
jgi:hypothetical protein